MMNGTVLKNTSWIVAVCVFTGNDTRMMMNSQQGANKRSNLDKTMNTFILYIVAFQIFCSTICAIRTAQVSEVPISLVIYNALPTIMTDGKAEADTQSNAVLGGETFAGMFLLLNTFIPISLVVTLEVCKVF
jgi:magnesium-transporting ATPase (P-type)